MELAPVSTATTTPPTSRSTNFCNDSLVQVCDNGVYFSPTIIGYGLYEGLHYTYGKGAPFLAACIGITTTSCILGTNIKWDFQSTYKTDPKKAALEYFRITFLCSLIPIFLNS